jgi:hypothetical protein
MKLSILIAAIGLVCSACSTYQYAVIDSDVKKTAGRIVFDNDTLQIHYKFGGNNGPATVGIVNKLDVPLYVDWHRSSLILEGKSLSRFPESARFQAVSTTTNFASWNYTTSDIRGTVEQPRPQGFVPPGSYIQSLPVYLDDQFSIPTPQLNTKVARGRTQKFKNFDKEDSPLLFRSYLTVSSAADFSEPMVFDHEFWVSEVAQSSVGPANMKQYRNRQDVYHVTRSEGGGGGFLLLILAIGCIFAASQ